MDESWRRYQRQRPEDPATLVVTSNDNTTNGTGNIGVSSSSSPTSETDPHTTGTRIDREDMVAEKLWEYVVGWCLIGCIFVGAGLIICANFLVHDDPANTTLWTFDLEEGASLMDTIVANIMKVALGIQDFEDQLMEHGIFVFIVGINGFVLVRQRVFGRRRRYEQELMRGGMMIPMETTKDIGGGGPAGYDLEGKAVVGGESLESEKDGEGFGEGKRDFYEDLHLHQGVAQGVERFTTTDQVSAQTGASTATAGTRAGASDGGPIENTPSFSTTSTSGVDPRPGTLPTTTPAAAGGLRLKEISTHHQHHTKDLQADEKKPTTAAAAAATGTGTGSLGNNDGNAPDFATMSFLAWFNYLQVGILIIEFLQLFSFPLRELMEFYNQAEKTSAMYEGAKTILDVFRTTATDAGDGTVSLAAAAGAGGGGGSGIQYKDGILSIGNNTLFDFSPRKSSTQDRKSVERPTFALEISEDDAARAAGSASAVLDQQHDEGEMEIFRKNASLPTQNVTDGSTASIIHKITGGGAQKLGASVEWIKENLHSWLPNITALMDNNTMDGLESGRFEELRDNLVNAAVGSVLYLPILSTFLSSAACQSQAIHAYAHEKYAQQQEQALHEKGGHNPKIQATSIFSSVIMTLLDPASTVAAPTPNSLLCTGPLVHPGLYLTASLFAYTLAYVLFMVFLTSFERVPGKGEICFRPNGVAVLKNLGLLLAVDFLLIQSPAQRRFRGLVSIGIMLTMACYTIRMKPCYWNKINYWRTFSFSCVLYASLLVALLCPSPPVLEKKSSTTGGGSTKAERERHREDIGRWVMSPHLKMGEGAGENSWMVMGKAGGGPKVMLAWIAAGWVLLVIVFVVVERVFLRHWTKKVAVVPVPVQFVMRSQPVGVGLLADGYGGYRGLDMFGRGVGGGEMGGFAPVTPGVGGGGGMYTNPGIAGSHWSVVDLSQTPEVRRSKVLNSS
ncbi:hypothetical protein BGZ89_006841 [Linnemannia elongata]|nr:hypothetical protein BGZ89_006841 [Linnemannia elongata]